MSPPYATFTQSANEAQRAADEEQRAADDAERIAIKRNVLSKPCKQRVDGII